MELMMKLMKNMLLFHILFVLLIVEFTNAQNRFDKTFYDAMWNVQLLGGRELAMDESLTRATFTLEHLGKVKAFEHFGYTDLIYNFQPGEFGFYTEYYPKISFGRLLNKNTKDEFLSDILLGIGTNFLITNKLDFFVFLTGPVWKLNMPGFNLFQIETYYYMQNEELGTFQLTPSWDASFNTYNNIRLRTRGFIDIIGPHGVGNTQLIMQPQILMDIGNFFKNPDKGYAGIEWHYWKNVGGDTEKTESIPQLQLIWFL
jgi:nucleoside-specific outer membrane channel protein Tsx